ncbi:diacylglycerol kinase family protein [Hephaestia mangrovi]|uniref:diacylglycerol kinase family protein n=1 Tax=Hephaestia mangrovi TaxID=2873268 RepID=UPI001CA68EE7|nr:diacylglycerol kinase family protein [Hephaestia mangrovi]MBY8827592.1 hypothetical protein [Hephaestia mangrovi]
MTRPTAIAADTAALGSPRMLHDGLLARADMPVRVEHPGRASWFSSDRIGVISNARSHRNKRDGITGVSAEVARFVETPRRRADLAGALARLAAANIDLLVIDGGDGTVRDVITAAPAFFGDRLPSLAVVPSGKTNALAIDLGIPASWTVEDAVAAARAGRFARRAPIEIAHEGSDAVPLRGFLFGAGAFVQATKLAQRTHRAGAFKGLAVGLSLTLALGQTAFGRKSNAWRAGQRMAIRTEDGRSVDRDFYILLGATLENLPLGLKPLGPVRPGLKVLAVDAPPKALALHVPALLAGSQSERLARAGYHHADPGAFRLSLDAEFILDGEHYPGGELIVATGAPIDFAVP